MTELEKGPRGLRRGRGARERILSASHQLFRDQGINCTGMDQLCAVAEVSKRTLYQHFTGKDELIAEHLRRFDPGILPEVFDRSDLTPRERLLAAFDVHAPLCPFIAAAVEIPDPGHPARVYARDYKLAFAARLTEAAREAGATDPEQLGEQLALLLDGASPAAESSTPRPSPPPAPSQPSSSTTPSPPPLDRAAIERAASRQARRHGSISAPQLASDHAKDFAANSSWPCIGVLVAGEMAGGSRGSNCAAKVG